mmetsp:Transcript_2224/g.5068  ORF Transcript_2224/g.5068 Transcript_2224/m.5068 type:complete len:203 (-) Transcript_2224:2065-2673(-)
MNRNVCLKASDGMQGKTGKFTFFFAFNVANASATVFDAMSRQELSSSWRSFTATNQPRSQASLGTISLLCPDSSRSECQSKPESRRASAAPSRTDPGDDGSEQMTITLARSSHITLAFTSVESTGSVVSSTRSLAATRSALGVAVGCLVGFFAILNAMFLVFTRTSEVRGVPISNFGNIRLSASNPRRISSSLPLTVEAMRS